MSFVNDVINRYPAIDVTLRKRLLADLTEAERVQAAAAPAKPKPQPPKAPASSGAAIREGARASENDPGDAVEELLRLAEDIHRRSPSISLEAAERVSLYGDSAVAVDLRRRVRKLSGADRDRLPLSVRSAAFYLEPPVVPTLRPDEQLAAAADALMLSEDFSGDYGDAMDKALADDAALAERYARRFSADEA